jgi:hypothetical protein
MFACFHGEQEGCQDGTHLSQSCIVLQPMQTSARKLVGGA